jgi:hypothetical protein
MNQVFDFMLMKFATDIQRRAFWEIPQMFTSDGSELILRTRRKKPICSIDKALR